jgi:hypothetical protein
MGVKGCGGSPTSSYTSHPASPRLPIQSSLFLPSHRPPFPPKPSSFCLPPHHPSFLPYLIHFIIPPTSSTPPSQLINPSPFSLGSRAHVVRALPLLLERKG